MKLHSGDQVIVTSGKDKGRHGAVLNVLPRQRRVIVQGLNIYKKHLKSRQGGQPGRIIERERPLPVANVALVCPKCKQPTRVGYRIDRDGRKLRICRKCDGEIRSAEAAVSKKKMTIAQTKGGKNEKNK